MNENWLPIKDYEGLYEVSNWGRVRSLGMWANGKNGCKCWRKGRLLRFVKDRCGYLSVNLCKDSTMKPCKVHRLVAMAFLPNPDNLPQVNHKDENKENNRVDNLEWCTGEYNYNFGTRNVRIGKALSRVVYMYTLNNKLCGLWPSTKECGRNGFDQSSISSCCNGKYKQYRGFKWSYEPPKPPKAIEFLTNENNREIR